MSTTITKQRIPLAQAQKIAHELIGMLGNTVDHIQIAGSIRRQSETVGDIELVLVPTVDVLRRDLFGEPVEWSNVFDVWCAELKHRGVLIDRLDKHGRPSWGSKYKRATYQGVAVDLFSANATNHGLILAIRTGPADFTRRFVTQRHKGGVLPDDMYVQSGSLWRKRWGEEPADIETPTEAAFFAAIGLPYVRPEDRT